MSERVGIAGLGRMGLPMARRLVAEGFEVVAYNRSATRAGQLRDEAGGAVTVAASPAELAGACDVVVTMLADGAAVERVTCGPDGLLSGAGSRTVIVEMSTIGPVLARELAQRAAASGAVLIDAPVSGSVPAATAGTLVAMVGGPADAVARAGDALDALTAHRFHVGPSGAGAAMKLALNSILAVFNEALAEGLVLAERAGIESEVAYDVIAHSALSAPYVDYKREAFVGDGAQDVSFTTALMRKDADLAVALGQDLGVPLVMAGAASAMLTIACANGHADDDIAAVADVLRGWKAGG